MVWEVLSNYPYDPHARVVGWLGMNSAFKTAVPPAAALEKLSKMLLSEKPNFCFGQARGFHHCEFCPDPPDPDVDIEGWFYHGTEVLSDGVSRRRLGSCRFLVRDISKPSNHYLVAPSLIYHYVREHRYCPPQVFWESVMAESLDSDFDAGRIFGG